MHTHNLGKSKLFSQFKKEYLQLLNLFLERQLSGPLTNYIQERHRLAKV